MTAHKGQFICQWCNSCDIDRETHFCSAFVPLDMVEVSRKSSKGDSNVAVLGTALVSLRGKLDGVFSSSSFSRSVGLR